MVIFGLMGSPSFGEYDSLYSSAYFFYKFNMKGLPYTIIVAKQNTNHFSEQYKTGNMWKQK